MGRIDEITAEARTKGVKPWLAVKELLAESVILSLAGDERVALQGGAALHFAYGSPRLSADVDYVGQSAAGVMAERGEEVARRAGEVAGAAAAWSISRVGRLTRGKVTIVLDAARRIVLPVEAFEVPAHLPVPIGRLGQVERIQEIAADKIVASADRLARRGAVKTRNLYDLWYIGSRAGAAPPDPSLIAQRLQDHGQPARGADVARAARAGTPEEMRTSLEGVLPAAESAATDPVEVVAVAADWLARYRDVL